MNDPWVHELFGKNVRHFNLVIVDACEGSIEAAIFLDHIIYLHQTWGYDWVYQTMDQIFDNTRLTRAYQERARKALIKLELIDERKEGMPAKLYFRLNLERYQALMELHAREAAAQVVVPEQTRMFRDSKQGCSPGTNMVVVPEQPLIGIDKRERVKKEIEYSPSVSPPSKSGRGERLPDGWVPNDAGLMFAVQEGLSHDTIQAELDKFRDYWIAQSGQKGVKLDWNATWRNWVRNSKAFSSGKRIVKEDDPERHDSLVRFMKGWKP